MHEYEQLLSKRVSAKVPQVLYTNHHAIPAQAGMACEPRVQFFLDSRLRGNDVRAGRVLYE
jgi:hypothetical protein